MKKIFHSLKNLFASALLDTITFRIMYLLFWHEKRSADRMACVNFVFNFQKSEFVPNWAFGRAGHQLSLVFGYQLFDIVVGHWSISAILLVLIEELKV